MSRAVRALLALGLLFASCSPATPTPTSFFLTVYFNPGLGTQALVFAGLGPNDVQYFAPRQLPMPVDPALKSPQSVRILMPDALAGQAVTLGVTGINADFESLEFGSQPATVVKNTEVEVSLTLAPVNPPGDGGVDAGRDGGTDGGSDGGTVACNCPSGCCLAGQAGCATSVILDANQGPGRPPISQFGCGEPFETCKATCDSFTASYSGTSCNSNTCNCGSGPRCDRGLQCVNGQCVCNVLSCAGCCSLNNTVCVSLGSTQRQVNQCGNTGNACETCSDGAQACTGSGVCPTCNVGTTSGVCCSGNGMSGVGFPRCRNSSNQCVACDLLRASRCGTGFEPTSCRCGLGDQCPAGKRCIKGNGGLFGCE